MSLLSKVLWLQEEGDYKICFDNKFSYLSSKIVYFEILNVNEDEDYDDLAGLWDENGDYTGDYDVEVSDIEVCLNKCHEVILGPRMCFGFQVLLKY